MQRVNDLVQLLQVRQPDVIALLDGVLDVLQIVVDLQHRQTHVARHSFISLVHLESPFCRFRLHRHTRRNGCPQKMM